MSGGSGGGGGTRTRWVRWAGKWGVADSGFVRCHIKWQTHLGDFFLFASLAIPLLIFLGSKNKCSNLATQFV